MLLDTGTGLHNPNPKDWTQNDRVTSPLEMTVVLPRQEQWKDRERSRLSNHHKNPMKSGRCVLQSDTQLLSTILLNKHKSTFKFLWKMELKDKFVWVQLF